jgi:hypothetical protein
MRKWREFGRLGQLRPLLREHNRGQEEHQRLLLVLLDKFLEIDDGLLLILDYDNTGRTLGWLTIGECLGFSTLHPTGMSVDEP